MSTLAHRVPLPRKAVWAQGYSAWIPLAGAGWVAVNLGLGALGTQMAHPPICGLLAGAVNGVMLSIVAVCMASERFQSGVTGLFGGMSLSGLRSDGSIIQHSINSVHHFVDTTLGGLGIPERFHQPILNETLYMVWTAVLVVLASLIIEWLRSARLKAERG